MKIKEFQEKYHDYMTEDPMEALSDALKLKVVDDEGKEHKIIPMKFGDKWCLMLDTAALAVKEMGIK